MILTQQTRTSWKAKPNRSFRSTAGTTLHLMQAPHLQTEPIGKRFTGIASSHACCATRPCKTPQRNYLVTRSAPLSYSRQLESTKFIIQMGSSPLLKWLLVAEIRSD